MVALNGHVSFQLKVICPDIIHPCRVVFVLMGKNHRVQFLNPRPLTSVGESQVQYQKPT